jgi:hypothetical protein
MRNVLSSRCGRSQLDSCPLAADATYVEHAPVDFKPVDSVGGSLRRGGNSQAGPHRYIWFLVVQFRDQGDGAVALERFTTNGAPQLIGGVLFPFPLFHSRLVRNKLTAWGVIVGRLTDCAKVLQLA